MTRTYRRDLIARRAQIREIVDKVRLHPLHQQQATRALAQIDAQLAPRRVNR